MVFLGWLFLEEKQYSFFLEKTIRRQAIWFYAVSSIAFMIIIFLSINRNPMLALSASVGATVFFVTDGFKKGAEEHEAKLLSPTLSAWSKLLYLEVLDSSFSIDGVVGAFAFTVSVPLIIVGNGIGAFVVRELTIRGIDVIAKYAYLKNGAMYSIGLLGIVMIIESFGHDLPFWIAPANTFLILSWFLYLSFKERRIAERDAMLPDDPEDARERHKHFSKHRRS
jgi:hypothetical protein